MIVPRTRLLVWFALVVAPFATMAGLVPGAELISFAAMALFGVMVLIDACLAARTLRGVAIELTPLVRITAEREFALNVRIQNSRQRARRVRAALAFPPALVPATDEMLVALPADSEWSAFDWRCVARRRGKFQISTARIEATSPLGLWSFWKTFPVRSEVRVYPNLALERKNLAALFLNRGTFGAHAQRQIGKGRDFEKLRDYIPGDSYDEVHWKATAKRGHPVTKVFQIERTQEIYVVIDASRLSGRAVSPKPKVRNPKESLSSGQPSIVTTLDEQRTTEDQPLTTNVLERFITAALVLGLAAEQQGDLFGLLTFSDKVDTFLRARNGKAHYHACRDALYTLETKEVTPDFNDLSTFVRLRLRRRALLLFLTSLDDPVLAESFVRNAGLIAGQHLILVNMLQPSGARPAFTERNVVSVDEMYEQLSGHLRWQKLRELEKVLQRRGVRFSLLSSERLAVDLVSQYVNVKQRQAL